VVGKGEGANGNKLPCLLTSSRPILALRPRPHPCPAPPLALHPRSQLKATFSLPIIGVKKNPSSPLYTQLGVITKGTVIEVNVSELGLVTTGGKVVWGKYAQVTNNPENDGCINAVLLV